MDDKTCRKDWKLKKDKSIIIEPSSGNTGIVLAGISSAQVTKYRLLYPKR